MRVVRYFLRTYPGHTAVVLLCLLGAALLEGVGLSVVLPLLSLATKKSAIEGEELSQLESMVNAAFAQLDLDPTFGVLTCVVAGAFWAKALLSLLAKRQVGYTVAQVATDLRLGLLRGLLSAQWSFYTRQPVGAIANALATEAPRAALSYNYFTQAVAAVLEASVYIAISIAISWEVTLAAGVVAAVMLFSLAALIRMSSRAGRRQTKLLKSLLSRVTDSLQAVKLLKATGREPLIVPLLESDTRRLNRTLRNRVFSKEAVRALQEPIILSFGLGGLFVALVTLEMALPQAFLLLLLYTRTLGAVNKFQRRQIALVADSSALSSLLKMVERAHDRRETSTGTRQPTLERGIELKDVRVEYDERDVLRNLSLEIPAGQITALIGESGAGKTTVADLVSGLVLPDEGEVLVDGVPVAQLDLQRWRHMIGYVPQEMLMLHDTIARNVSLGDAQISRAEVERALRDACAWEFVEKLPEGMDTSVGERGALFSGGQRQRIALARALVHGARLLILDEATAALDPESEAAVWAAVERLRGKTTVLAVSHQPALKGIADRIYRIETTRASRV